MGLKIYIGQELAKRIDAIDNNSSLTDIRKMLVHKYTDGAGRWVEICGLYSPVNKINQLISSVKAGSIGSNDAINQNFAEIYNNYYQYSWVWCSDLIYQQTGNTTANLTADNLIQIISYWKVNSIKLNNMIMKDAEKEFDISSKLGFGIDGDEETRELDFKAVRGSYEDNKFVSGLQKESKDIEVNADRLLAILEKAD